MLSSACSAQVSVCETHRQTPGREGSTTSPSDCLRRGGTGQEAAGRDGPIASKQVILVSMEGVSATAWEGPGSSVLGMCHLFSEIKRVRNAVYERLCTDSMCPLKP